MKIIRFLAAFLILYIITSDVYMGISFSIFIFLVYEILVHSDKMFVFREWSLLLYVINYLIAPAITYNLPDEQVQYGMQIPYDEYFDLAIPGFLAFMIGMYVIPTNIFEIDYKTVSKSTLVNKKFLIRTSIIGLLLSFSSSIIPGEIGFFVYLLSLIRFVAAFALISIDKKFWYLPVIIILSELFQGFIKGMYHDALMWVIFYGLFYLYALKPGLISRMVGMALSVLLILFVQAVKLTYREQVWREGSEASLKTAYKVGETKAEIKQIFAEENLLNTLSRGNQAWIFASTVKNLETNKNFAGLTNVNKYLEAAILPRFLAPDKISSGNKDIFNKYSGHIIGDGTSMGLGVFSDGYIAYGSLGVYIFGFALGLIFSLTFKLVERWTKVSPFYVLLILPLLNYAVRPDCELQTTINHLFKGVMLYGILVYLTRKRFTLDSQENRRKLLHLNLVTNSK